MTQTDTPPIDASAATQRPRTTVTDLVLTNASPGTVSNVPLTTGVDFPRGQFHDATFTVRAETGAAIAAQTTPLARWSDGSLKWVLFDMVATHVRSGRSHFALEPADVTRSQAEVSPQPVVTIAASVVSFECGDLTASAEFVLRSTTGVETHPVIDDQQWEASGPVRHTLRVSGTVPGRRGLRFLARFHCYPATGQIKTDVRLHNSRRARHPGGQWDLGDSNSIAFSSFDVVIRPSFAAAQVRWAAEIGQPEMSADTGELHIYQDSSGGENWQSRNHVNAQGHVPCRLRGYRLEAPGRSERGLRATPTVSLDGEAGSLVAGVPEFWQQFPTSLAATSEEIRIGLFPKAWDGPFELQGGEQKTLSFWLAASTLTQELSAFNWIHEPVRLQPSPDWHAQTAVFPYFVEAGDDPHTYVGEALTHAVDGPRSLLARREIIDEYGWRNFGEVWADHEQAYCKTTEPVVSHYNNQFDVLYGGILQAARTGNANWWNLFEPLARHVIDIDLYHTNDDRAAYNGGLFWHTDHYVSAGTCTHRTYSRSNARPGQDYGGGPSDEHNYTTGLLYYYYLTGNPDARDAVISLADWVLNVDDGSQTIFGLVDDGPTGLASATAFPDYHGPGRGAGNSVNALLDGWQLTGDSKYLDYAETLIRRVVSPQDDIAGLDLLNVEARWSYTVFLSALAKYLGLKNESGQCDDDYHYAASSLAHYGRWMLQNELPYFDQREKLEFPTETWPAQDLRKANVLRLAARYCSGDEQSQMIKRGHDLATRAWQDLREFETRSVARALTLVMTEGVKDCWLRTNEAAPYESVHSNSPASVPFVGQKDRVRQQLKSPGGLCRAVLRAANPTRWFPFLRNLRRQL
jgi:hypothetical protein